MRGALPLHLTVLWALVGLPRALSLAGEVLEEWVLIIDPVNELGENPRISGGRVVWSRSGTRDGTSRSRIQCRDLRFAEGAVVDLVRHPASHARVLLTGEFLVTGGGDIPAIAHRLSACEVEESAVLVSDLAVPFAANENFVFLRVGLWGPEELRQTYLAKPLERLGDPEAFVEVGRFATRNFLNRTEAASDHYFVYVGRESSRESWKVHVIDISRGLPGTPRRLIDTRLHGRHATGAVYHALHQSYLVFQGGFDANPEFPWGIFFVDLAKDAEPEPVALIDTEEYRLAWPAVSEEFVVWTRIFDFSWREPFAMRVVGGRPSGESFSLGLGGSWLEIERNIVVFNGWVWDSEGRAYSAIGAREIDMPGAPDIGDADANGRVNISDAVVILRYLFAGGPRPRLRLGDADLDREITVRDALKVLRSLFPKGHEP